MPDENYPKTWYDATKTTHTTLPWREAAGGILVLGEDFPTALRPAQAATPAFAALPTMASLATPAIANQTQSPEAQRGEWVHAALQGITVAAPKAQRAEAEALALKVRNAFPWAFGAGSLAEVEVVLANGALGRIDRLAPHEGALWVLDFKTGAPQAPVPASYAMQLQSYATALAPSYPETQLRLGLVWVESCTLVEVAVSG